MGRVTGPLRAQLAQMLKTRSVRHGDFVLASGQRSNLYVDAKLTTFAAEALRIIGAVFIARMREHGWHPSCVGGLTMGADPIAMAIARESLETGSLIDAFSVRKDPKKHGLQKYLEGLAQTEGVDAVILDDVCTTGGSTAKAIERSRESGLNVLGALCLVDRQMGAKENIERQFGCPFDSIFTISELLD